MAGIEIPSIAQLLEVAPVATIVMLIAAIGFIAGWKSRNPHIEDLREWLNDFRNRPKRTPKDHHDVDD